MSTTVETTPGLDRPQAEPAAHDNRPLVVALAGNPNAGKTSLFNCLTGLRQKVANYPGVTVERKEGQWALADDSPPARLIDLPGLYSLDAASIDEQIARDVIMGRAAGVPAPDVIVTVVDATNLERNLYLVTQLLEYGRPVVIALTMMDLAEQRRFEIDTEKLAGALGIPVVPVVASQRRGLNELATAVRQAAAHGTSASAGWRLSEATERELAALIDAAGNGAGRSAALQDLYGEELPGDPGRRNLVLAARQRLAAADPNWWREPMLARYRWIESIVARAVRAPSEERPHTTERIDRWATHKVFGPIILLLVLLLVFQTIFSWAQMPMNLIDRGFGTLADQTRALLPPGLLADLLADGVIAGVGGVLVFLPQILLLFFFIGILEDTGYMSRAAFLLDRLMRGVGLHGKAFVPLLSGFACAIPGIMATRTIENPRDRLATIMIVPFMSCSARLPVYTLMIAAFFADRKLFGFLSVGALLIVAMYLLGITVAVCVAWVLKHTILKAPPPPLVMEMPPYRMPNLLNLWQTMWSRARLFIRRAGTVILAISIVLWALMNFPRSQTKQDAPMSAGAAQPAEHDTARTATGADKGAQLRNSLAGRAGHAIEPLIAPLGFDWKMGVALIASFAAREVLVSTLSIIYNVGADAEADSPSLIEAVRNARRPDGSPAWTPLVAVSMMVFFVLACQCMSTVAVVRRETNSWRWPLLMVVYMTVLAYTASLITFQGGRLLGFQ
jgi:ferrous iron transport protein B